MSSALRVIEKFGGQSNLAALLGKRQSTVEYWAKTGTIPARWHGKLIGLAKENGINLHAKDLIEVPPTKSLLSPIDDKNQSSLPISQWPGVLSIGKFELPVFVLNDGRRVISRNAATNLLTGKRSGDLESYLSVEALAPYLPDLAGHLIEFVLPGQEHKTTVGISTETYLDICTAYVQALDEGNLRTPRQKAIATKASMFLASCAKVGLDALIDEVTGYQYIREEDELQFRLRLYLEKEMRKWERTFPKELWDQFGRLTHMESSPSQRPRYWGKLVMELIYDYLEPDVAKWLRENNPAPRKGKNHHQWLNEQYGLKKLTEHIWKVIGMATVCNSMRELRMKMAETYGRAPKQYTLFESESIPWSPPKKKAHVIDGSIADSQKQKEDDKQLVLDI